MAATLNSNYLGEKGEARFKELCADAQLVCNESDRDLTGWDFIVEFPFANDGQPPAPLQNRRTPISCHVQVKTIMARNDSVQLRLSSAERLAKEAKPSFVVVLRVDDDLNFVDGLLIHVLGEPLGRILKRLRNADAGGKDAVNDETISLLAEKNGYRFAITGAALKEAIATACGSDMHAYILEKRSQLAKLGYGEHRFKMTLSMHLNSEDELVDAFLGLKKDIPASNVATFETRFGIDLPMEPMIGHGATFTISPLPVDQCTIVARRNISTQPATFKGEMFVPAIPGASKELRKTLIKSDLFSITVQAGSWSLIANETPEPQTPTAWAAYWRLYEMLALGEGTLELTPLSLPNAIPLRIGNAAISLHPEQANHFIHICEMLSDLLKFGGVLSEPTVTLDEISLHQDQILSASSLVARTAEMPNLSFATEWNDALTQAFEHDAIYADYLSLGGVTLAYYAVTRILGTREGDCVKCEAGNMMLGRITHLQSFPQQFDQFVKDAQEQTGITACVVRFPVTEGDAANQNS